MAMNAKEILGLPSMPLAAPSYPRGPYRFIDREYLIVSYKSDPDAIRAALPEPLLPDGSNTVLYEFIRMPDSAGFGDYTESGVVIPAMFDGKPVNFTAQMYLDDEPPIAGGREIWGFRRRTQTRDWRSSTTRSPAFSNMPASSSPSPPWVTSISTCSTTLPGAGIAAPKRSSSA